MVISMKREQMMKDVMRHVNSCCKMYREQMER